MTNLIATLTAAGIQVRADAGELVIRAPKGVLTPELRKLVASNKAALLATLAGEAAPQLLPVGALPLWLFDRVHGIDPPLPAPLDLTADQIAAAVAQARTSYEAEVQRWRVHPPALRASEPWRPNAPCHRCDVFDWYADGTGKWRCGRCTPRTIEAETSDEIGGVL